MAVFLLVAPGSAWGKGLIGGNYTLNWDSDLDRTEVGSDETHTFKHVLDIKYSGFLSPVVENEITLKIEQERKSDADPPTTTKIYPEVSLDYKGSYWNAGVKRTIEDSNEPGVERKTLDTYFGEFFFLPPVKTMPDLKGKYTLDKEFQEKSTDTIEQEITLSSVYRPMNWIELKGDYKRNVKEDNLSSDSDKEEEQYSTTIGIRHFFSQKIRVSSDFTLEILRGATLLDGGGAKDQKEEQTYTWKNTLAFRPFRETTFDAYYDLDLKQNIASGEHTNQDNWKMTIGQAVNMFNIKGDYSHQVTEVLHTEDDSVKTEDIWTLEVGSKLSKHFDLTVRFQKTDSDEVYPTDPTKNITTETINRIITWTGDLTPFWKASASYDKTDNIEDGSTSTIDTKYSFKSTFDFKRIFLTLDPSYDITRIEDFVQSPASESETRDFRFRIAWKVFSTNNMEAKIDHTYGRKTDSSAGNIERTDSSTGELIWTKPFPGWDIGFTVTRSANDISEDDAPAQINSTFGFKGDYSHKKLIMSTNYKYDMDNQSDNSETFEFKIGWVAVRWDATFTYTLDKTFSELLDEKHTVSIEFKYKI